MSPDLVIRSVTVREMLDATGKTSVEVVTLGDLTVWQVLGLLAYADVMARMQVDPLEPPL